MAYPADLKYSKDHEWVRINGETADIGITDYAQQQLGDVVYVDLPDVGRRLNAGESFGSIESVKAVSELFSPISGEVVEVNKAAVGEPGIVNDDPFGDGWLIKLKLSTDEEVAKLLSAEQYDEYVKQEEKER